MGKHKKRRVPNYVLKIRFLQRHGALPSTGVMELNVRHDSWCTYWSTHGNCTCNPKIERRWALPAGSQN